MYGDTPDGLPTLREIKTTTAKSVVAGVKAKVLSFGARVSNAMTPASTGSYAFAA